MNDGIYICLNRATAGRGWPFEEFVQLAADAGFAGADVDLGWAAARGADALQDLFARHGLRFGGWGTGFDWRNQSPPSSRDLAELDKQAAIASRLRIDTCCTWIMPSADRRFSDNWKFHIQRLAPIAQILERHGSRLGLEFVAPYHLRRLSPHEFIFTPGQMLELAGEIGPNAGLLVDLFHCHASGTPHDQIGEIPVEKIVLVHLNDVPPLELHELRDDQRLLPGEGAGNVVGFIEALGRAGYRGAVSVEVFSDQLNSLPPAQAARQAWLATANCLQGAACS